MMTSAVLLNGPEHFGTVERELVQWMDANEYESVSELRGSASYFADRRPVGLRAGELREDAALLERAAVAAAAGSPGVLRPARVEANGTLAA